MTYQSEVYRTVASEFCDIVRHEMIIFILSMISNDQSSPLSF